MPVPHSSARIHTGLRRAARDPLVPGVFLLSVALLSVVFLSIALLFIAFLSIASLPAAPMSIGATLPAIAGTLPSSAWVILGGALALCAMRRRAGAARQRQWRAKVYRLPSTRRAALLQRNLARRTRCNTVPAIPFDNRSSVDRRAIASGSCRQRG